ncbi:MAG: reverse transcriptase-like protein [Calditrichaeota bacterium]|nr:MAG: reverse transcriptase-like protein [Calditrichota bacterium]
MKQLVLHTDGASRGNPGPAGIGVVLQDADGETLEEQGAFIGRKTNNEAEYQALLKGLELAAAYRPEELIVYLDSELVVRQIQGEYRVRNARLKPLFERVMQALSKFPKWKVAHVRRGLNKRADQLANRAIDAAEGQLNRSAGQKN